MAVTTSTAICNVALMRLGADTISNITDGSVNAGYCTFVYPRARNWLLRRFEWDFAIKRETLALDAGANLTSFDNKYQLPSGLLRVLNLLDSNGDEPPVTGPDLYLVEDQYLYTDLDDAMLKYIWEVTETQRFDETFVEVLGLLIAHRLALRITSSERIRKEIYTEFRYELREAIGLDAMGGQNEPAEVPLWTNSR